MQISVAWFDHMHDNMPKMVFSSWDEFVATLEVAAKVDRNAIDKPHSPSVSPAIYNAGGRRKNAEVQGFGGWFAIDIDDAGCTLQDASDLCSAAGVSHVIWTTTSHTDDAHRYRVAFPLDRNVAQGEMRMFWAGTHAFFKGWGDVKTKDPARLMIAPARWRGTNPKFMRVDGLGVMSVDRILEVANATTISVAAGTPASKRPARVAASVAASQEHVRAQLAIGKWRGGTLTKADLHGVKAKHLVPPSNKAQKHGRGGRRLAAAKKTLDKMKNDAK